MVERERLVSEPEAAWKADTHGRLLEMSVFSRAEGQPVLVGTLSFQASRRGVRQGTFRYDRDWVGSGVAAPLFAAGLPLRRPTQSKPPFEVPLPFYDASPDGWGKALLRMAYPDVDLGAPEYIAASGNNRTGDLVFGPDGSGPAVYTPSTAMLDLPQDDDRLGDLIEAAEAVESGIATRSHLARLLQSGADIGGARPKARIMFDGRPCILKMKAADDGVDVQRLEAACLSVARSAGIETPWHTVVEVNGQSALIIERFDRDGEIRVPFTSAATVMEEPPSSYDNTGASYASVSVMARRAGILDCSRDLFRRLLLNCFLNNTDDHLHNHGFIRVGGQWKLSPVFDVVTQRRRALVLRPAKDVSAEANPTTALTAHTAFGIDRDEAQAIHDEVKMAAADFRDWLRHYGANDADISTASSLAPHAVAAETPSRSRNIIDDEPASPEP